MEVGLLGWSDIGIAALAACGLSLLLCLPLVATRRWHGRFTNDATRGVQKFHRVPTPRIGGLALALAYALVWPVLPERAAARLARDRARRALPLRAGLGEDLTGKVGVRYRLLATMGAASLFALLTGYTMHKVDLPGIDWLLSFYLVALLFTGFAMGGVANAINIIDGFNGLASGSLLIMLAAFAWVAHRVGDDLVSRWRSSTGRWSSGSSWSTSRSARSSWATAAPISPASCWRRSACCCRCATRRPRPGPRS